MLSRTYMVFPFSNSAILSVMAVSLFMVCKVIIFPRHFFFKAKHFLLNFIGCNRIIFLCLQLWLALLVTVAQPNQDSPQGSILPLSKAGRGVCLRRLPQYLLQFGKNHSFVNFFKLSYEITKYKQLYLDSFKISLLSACFIPFILPGPEGRTVSKREKVLLPPWSLHFIVEIDKPDKATRFNCIYEQMLSKNWSKEGDMEDLVQVRVGQWLVVHEF